MPPLGGDGQHEVEALLNAEHHERDHHQLQVLLHLLDRGLPAGCSLQLCVSTKGSLKRRKPNNMMKLLCNTSIFDRKAPDIREVSKMID